MIFKIITLFPEFFESPLNTGLLGKAITSKIIKIQIVDLKSYTKDDYHRCDDYTYGGGSGMVLRPEPLFKALKSTMEKETMVILPTPAGELLDQDLVKLFSEKNNICIICGHYEGIDQRVIDKFVDFEVSIGDYVLSGGEFAALVILNATVRYIPGFMTNQHSLKEESFENGLLEYPHYTRPFEIEGLRVPDVLLSGNHKEIAKWRLEKSIERTRTRRPDLYNKYFLRKLQGEKNE